MVNSQTAYYKRNTIKTMYNANQKVINNLFRLFNLSTNKLLLINLIFLQTTFYLKHLDDIKYLSTSLNLY